jgi:hypothetical protein
MRQGVSVEKFSTRMKQSLSDGVTELVTAWDDLIASFNAQSGIGRALGH